MFMLDAKVLAAVLASLTAVAAGMNGGAIDADMAVEDVSTGGADVFDLQSLSSNPLDKLKNMFLSRPEPTNQVKANLTIDNLDDETIKVQDAVLSPPNLTEIKIGPRKMSSDEDISFNGFRGSIKPGSPTSVQGTANSALSSGVNISGMINVNEKLNTSQVRINEKGKAKLSLSNVKGEISSGSASTEFQESNRNLKINSFTGKITIYTSNNSVMLDGKVDRLEAGQFSFGG